MKFFRQIQIAGQFYRAQLPTDELSAAGSKNARQSKRTISKSEVALC